MHGRTKQTQTIGWEGPQAVFDPQWSIPRLSLLTIAAPSDSERQSLLVRCFCERVRYSPAWRWLKLGRGVFTKSVPGADPTLDSQ